MSNKDYSVRNVLNKLKCAIYIRVSTHYQIDKDSLPLQREDLINYAKYALNIDSYEVFEDAGYSAKNTDRPAYQQMMSRLRTGEFSHILVWKIDRISRNLLDFAAMYEEIKSLGVTFVSKNEQFDTSTAIGEAMLKIILVFAELERNMTSERVTAVMLSRAANGQWNGGRIPYGYDYHKESKEFTINQFEAENILKIVDLYLETHSLLSVAKYLNKNGITTKAGNEWNPTTVSKMIRSRFYLGEYQYNMHKDGMGGAGSKYLKPESEWITVVDHHPAILTHDQWNACAEIRNKNHKNSECKKTYKRKNTHIFAGLIECGECGGNYTATLDSERAGGYRPSIYLCSTRRRFSKCSNKCVSDITLGPFILNYISNMMKANNNIGKSTTLDMFQKKLLRGDVFAGVKGIEASGLKETYDMMRNKKFDSDVFEASRPSSEVEGYTTEKDLLMSEKRKHERALDRLKALYLYSEEAITETDYIIENKRLRDKVDEIDKRLEEIDKSISESFSISDSEFIEKASYFIMSQELSSKRSVNFHTLVRNTDTEIIKRFIQSVIKKIVIFNDKVQSIQFKNGIEHKFLYE